MAITEAVAVGAIKEGAKALAKKAVEKAVKEGVKAAAQKAAKDTAKKVVKKAMKDGAKKAVKGALQEKPKKVPLYTEEEKSELQSLRNKRSYYKKRLEELSKEINETETRTLQELRKNISDDTAYELKNKGYFDPDKKIEYSNRDFREWMSSNGDSDLIQRVADDYNSLATEGSEIIGEGDNDVQKKMNEYAKRVKTADEEIARIQKQAHDRRNMKIAKDLARRNRLENQESLIEAFDQGDILISKLSNPEREAVNFVKDRFATSIINNLDFSEMSEDKALALKHGIYKGITDNPMEGFRTGLKEAVSSEVMQIYGNEAGDVVSKLVDLATGKGSVSSVGLSVFNGIINKSGLNEDLMNERAEDLIESGESTEIDEVIKKFGRDAIVDIGKAVIKTGGNLDAALPIAIKSVLLDAGKAVKKIVK